MSMHDLLALLGALLLTGAIWLIFGIADDGTHGSLLGWASWRRKRKDKEDS